MRSHQPARRRRVLAAVLTASVASLALGTAAQSASAAGTVPSGFTVHTLGTAPAGLTSPDDITRLGDHLFIAYQNGVGSKGEPAPNGTTKSTIVEETLTGSPVASWPVVGKVDGMGADAANGRVLASVNEDANSSLYSITPGGQPQHYTYAGLTHGGGTDSVLAVGGTVYITASAPAADADGKTYSKPALYTATFSAGVVTLTPVIADNATATDVVTGKSTKLNLSDPDSSETVPAAVPGLGGHLLLDSQGDKQLVFLGGSTPKVLNLTTQVDDTAFATSQTGTLYVVDSKSNKLLAITGSFTVGQAFTSVPSDSDTLPGTLGTIDLKTGTVSSFLSLGSPKGLLFVNDSLPVGTPTGSPSTGASAPASAPAGNSASASPTGPTLAKTGSSGTGTIVGIAAGVVVLGAGAVYFTRRQGRRA